jgi:hypothetical protein
VRSTFSLGEEEVLLLFDDDSLVVLNDHDIGLGTRKLLFVHRPFTHQHSDFRGFVLQHLNYMGEFIKLLGNYHAVS